LLFAAPDHTDKERCSKGVIEIVKYAVLFVCLGNICRSPLAEAAFRLVTSKAGLSYRIDSAGTGNWHVGDAPDRRAQQIAQKQGVDISRYQARQVRGQDFDDFTHIIAMDADNLANLQRLRPETAQAKLSLLLDHVPGREGQSVADPYYGGVYDFEICWHDVRDGAEGLFKKLRSQLQG